MNKVLPEIHFGDPWMGGPFRLFLFPDGPVEGVAMEEEKRLLVLAVAASERGQGAFTRFLDHALTKYESVSFLEMMSPRLTEHLHRRGATDTIETIDLLDGGFEHSRALILKGTQNGK